MKELTMKQLNNYFAMSVAITVLWVVVLFTHLKIDDNVVAKNQHTIMNTQTIIVSNQNTIISNQSTIVWELLKLK